jgi:hypothetical protein
MNVNSPIGPAANCLEQLIGRRNRNPFARLFRVDADHAITQVRSAHLNRVAATETCCTQNLEGDALACPERPVVAERRDIVFRPDGEAFSLRADCSSVESDCVDAVADRVAALQRAFGRTPV